jgi:hypothetical protein
MGFFDTFQDTSSTGYINEADKSKLIEDGVPFPITGLKLDEHPKYGTRYVASVTVPAGALDNEEDDDRLISFPYGTVDSRDRMLGEMSKWLDDPTNEPPLCKLERVGRSILVRPAEGK